MEYAHERVSGRDWVLRLYSSRSTSLTNRLQVRNRLHAPLPVMARFARERLCVKAHGSLEEMIVPRETRLTRERSTHLCLGGATRTLI